MKKEKKKIILNNKEYTVVDEFIRAYYYYAIIKENNMCYFLKQSTSDDTEYIKALNKEIEILELINSNKTPKIIDFVKDKYIIYNYIDGTNLTYINNISLSDSIMIIISLCRILNEIHNLGYTHNDLKKGNIIVGKDKKIYLIDFGNSTKYGELPYFGTPNVSSPELILKKPLTNHSDIYSLGVLLHDFIDKKELFKTDDVNILIDLKQKIIPYIETEIDCKKEINDIITKSANPDIDKRYKNVLEMEKDLTDLIKKINY